jgi:hypothetical protein
VQPQSPDSWQQSFDRRSEAAEPRKTPRNNKE